MVDDTLRRLASAPIELRRLRIPLAALRNPIDDEQRRYVHPHAIDILPTQNTGVNDIALASTGDALVAVWADNRWGATREIYAAPINLRSCP